MSGIVRAMLSSTSLAAFSSATTSPINGTGPLRLVREPQKPTDQPQQTFKNTLPSSPPGIVPPRGSLLNLSI